MRRCSPARALVALALAAASCGGRDAALEPAHGGVLAALDAVTVELVGHASGDVMVFVRQGALGDEAGLTVTVRDEQGNARSVPLRRVDEAFVGGLVDPLGDGPVEVLLVSEGRRARATVSLGELIPEPVHDGSVLRVGGRLVEVEVDRDGAARLHVREPADERGLDLTLVLRAEGRHPLALAWDASERCYMGRLEGVTPRAGLVEVLLVEGERTHVGRGLRAEPRPSLLEGLVPDGLRLELPELGSNLPTVIAIPPPDATDEEER